MLNYDPLIEFVSRMTSSGFLKQSNQDMLLVANTVDEALEQMQQYGVPIEGKWIGRD